MPFPLEVPVPKKIFKAKTEKKRQPWSEEEDKEINGIFKDFLASNTCPRQKDCLKAIDLSKKKNGKIQFREWSLIKKKVANMIATKKRNS